MKLGRYPLAPSRAFVKGKRVLSPGHGPLRRWLVGVLVVSALWLGAPGETAAGATRVTAANGAEARLVVLINNLRRHHGLRPVRASRQLARAAASHSSAMARRGFFSHTSRDGTSFWGRIARFYPHRGYSSWAVGENLAWGPRWMSAGRALRRWLASAGHRRVLLTPKWRHLGIGAVRARSARGYFGGRSVLIITADFGARRR